MLRTLTFVTMRQEEGETADATPLRFTRRQELIDDDLRTVGEVTELTFPDIQRHWIRR